MEILFENIDFAVDFSVDFLGLISICLVGLPCLQSFLGIEDYLQSTCCLLRRKWEKYHNLPGDFCLSKPQIQKELFSHTQINIIINNGFCFPKLIQKKGLIDVPFFGERYTIQVTAHLFFIEFWSELLLPLFPETKYLPHILPLFQKYRHAPFCKDIELYTCSKF